MKKNEILGTLVAYFILGAVVVAGMRAAEWLIPQPEARILVCVTSDTGKRDCRTWLN